MHGHQGFGNARIGQGLFRKQVLSLWGGRCAVTGSAVLDAIRASHIKPWRSSDNAERLEPCNGLPLVASLDALFDAGFITFADDGWTLVSPRLNFEEHGIFALTPSRLRKPPPPQTAQFLAYHRSNIFRM